MLILMCDKKSNCLMEINDSLALIFIVYYLVLPTLSSNPHRVL